MDGAEGLGSCAGGVGRSLTQPPAEGGECPHEPILASSKAEPENFRL